MQGELPNNAIVAVKQLFMKTQQASDEFINEIVLIINLQHRNLVNLKGYCVNGKEMLLIYEYVDNHDLDKILFGEFISNIFIANNINGL
jgi:serine/threonine protein kinase